LTVSKITVSSSSPAPFLIARSIVSRDIDALRAASTAIRSRGFIVGSAPSRAATISSREMRVMIRPLAFAAASRPFCFH